MKKFVCNNKRAFKLMSQYIRYCRNFDELEFNRLAKPRLSSFGFYLFLQDYPFLAKPLMDKY